MASENQLTSETRFPFKTDVQVAMGRQRVPGASFDIGLTSLFIAVDPVPPVDSLLQLEISSPTGSLKFNSKVTMARSRSNGPDEPSGIEVALTLDTDELSTNWRKFVSNAARESNVANSEFVGALVEDNLGTTSPLSPEALLNIYAVDIPRGFIFLKTHTSRTEGEIIAVNLMGKNTSISPPSLNLHGSIVKQYTTPSVSGYQLSFIDINQTYLDRFWGFICSQTPSRYPPMDFPESS